MDSPTAVPSPDRFGRRPPKPRGPTPTDHHLVALLEQQHVARVLAGGARQLEALLDANEFSARSLGISPRRAAAALHIAVQAGYRNGAVPRG